MMGSMGTDIFKVDASWADKLTKTRVQFLLTPTVANPPSLTEAATTLVTAVNLIKIQMVKWSQSQTSENILPCVE